MENSPATIEGMGNAGDLRHGSDKYAAGLLNADGMVYGLDERGEEGTKGINCPCQQR